MQTEKVLTLREYGRILWKRKVLLLAILLTFLAATSVATHFMPNVYRGEAVLLLKGELKEYLSARDLIDLIGATPRDRLAVMLPKHSAHVRALSFAELKGSANKIKITVDADQVDEIQAVVEESTEYLRNMQLVKQYSEEHQVLLNKKLEELSLVVAQTSVMQASLQRMMNMGKLSSIGFNPAEMDRRIADYRIEMFTLQQLKKSPSGLEIADKAYTLNTPIKPKPALYLLLAGTMALFIGVIVAPLLESRQPSSPSPSSRDTSKA